MLQGTKRSIEQPIKNDVNDPKLDAIITAVDKLDFFKKNNADHDSIKNNVIGILQSYYKQGYTAMKAGCNEDTEIILQKPNTDKCKGIELGLAYFQYGECQNRSQFHIICGVKYEFNDKYEKEKCIYYEDGNPVAVADEERIEKIKKIAGGTDNTYHELNDCKPVEVTDEKLIEKNQAIDVEKGSEVGFCNKYFGWCSCYNGNDEKELANLHDNDNRGDINVNHYQYA